MKKILICFGLVLASLLGTSSVSAQSEDELKDLARKLERMVERLDKKSNDLEKHIDSVVDQNADDLEDWADKYESQWMRWAEGLEKRLGNWGEDQEDVWQDWAERFNDKWEDWVEELDEREMDSEQVGDLIRKNLKMLGEMPLGDFVEGLMEQGAKGAESAPWESLGDLQSVFKNSIERSVRETERRLQEARRQRAAAQQESDKDEPLKFILPLDEPAGVKAIGPRGQRANELDAKSKAAAMAIGKKLSTGSVDPKDVEQLMELVRRMNKQQATQQESRNGAVVSAKQQQREKVEAARRAAARRLQLDRNTATNRSTAEEKSEELTEVELLRKELQQLRREIERLKK